MLFLWVGLHQIVDVPPSKPITCHCYSSPHFLPTYNSIDTFHIKMNPASYESLDILISFASSSHNGRKLEPRDLLISRSCDGTRVKDRQRLNMGISA